MSEELHYIDMTATAFEKSWRRGDSIIHKVLVISIIDVNPRFCRIKTFGIYQMHSISFMSDKIQVSVR